MLNLTLLTALLLVSMSVALAAGELMLYPLVPGLAASKHHKVNVHSARDLRPTRLQFVTCIKISNPYSNDAVHRAPGDMSCLFYQNISIATPSVLSEPHLFWDQALSRIRNLTFKNLTEAGMEILAPEFFKRNRFGEELNFAGGAVSKTGMEEQL